MGKLKINKIPGRGKNAVEMDPAKLTVVGDIDESKLQPTGRKKLVLVLRDTDGTNYVVDGRHTTERAKREGTKVKVVFITDDVQLGRQSAIERLLGMLTPRKK